MGGRTVFVKPWGMATGRRLAPRVAALFKRLRGFAASDLAALVQEAQDEVYDVVRASVGFSTEQMDELSYEDLFTLADAVINVCIIRRVDGGPVEGAAGKLLTLAGVDPVLLGQRALSASRAQPQPTVESPKPLSS
jgi:hypothetical protein